MELPGEPFPGYLTLGAGFSLALWGSLAALTFACGWRVVRDVRRGSASRLTSVALGVATCGAGLLVAETGVRGYERFTLGRPFWAQVATRLDPLTGWAGQEFPLRQASLRPRLLVVGDSFTYAAGVPPDRPYHQAVARKLGIAVYAIGGGGWGTLQEYLLLDRRIDALRPDLVVLQVSSNDLFNNDWEMEARTAVATNLLVRPFFVGERVVYRYPGRLGLLQPFLTAHSRLAYSVSTAWQQRTAALAYQGRVPDSLPQAVAHGLEYPPLRRSVATTSDLVHRLRRRAAPAPLVAFQVDRSGIFSTLLQEIFAREGIPFFDALPDAVEREEQRGRRLRLDDGAHWNADGHEVAGRALAEWLRPFVGEAAGQTAAAGRN
jgi:lysophospholipase L1-like esterase